MRALRAVEQVHGLFLLRGRGGEVAAVGVGFRVGDAGGAAEEADTEAVPEAEEEGAGGRDEDVAGGLASVYRVFMCRSMERERGMGGSALRTRSPWVRS